MVGQLEKVVGVMVSDDCDVFTKYLDRVSRTRVLRRLFETWKEAYLQPREHDELSLWYKDGGITTNEIVRVDSHASTQESVDYGRPTAHFTMFSDQSSLNSEKTLKAPIATRNVSFGASLLQRQLVEEHRNVEESEEVSNISTRAPKNKVLKQISGHGSTDVLTLPLSSSMYVKHDADLLSNNGTMGTDGASVIHVTVHEGVHYGNELLSTLFQEVSPRLSAQGSRSISSLSDLEDSVYSPVSKGTLRPKKHPSNGRSEASGRSHRVSGAKEPISSKESDPLLGVSGRAKGSNWCSDICAVPVKMATSCFTKCFRA